MAIKPIVPPKVELRCVKNADGTFDAGAYADDQRLDPAKYSVDHGNCNDIRALYAKLRDAYPDDVPILIGEPCRHCIPS